MKLSRKEFLKSFSSIGISSLIPLNLFWRTSSWAKDFFRNKFPNIRVSENLFLAFNNIQDPEGGESDEFTTVRRIQNILTEMNVPRGTSIIGIGARTGHPNNPYGKPGEMGYLWKNGEHWDANVTSPIDASPTPLYLDDPIAVTQVGVLHEATAHHFEINDSSLEGSVLWTFNHDETGIPEIGEGMHSIFSDLDGGMTNDIFEVSKKALKSPDNWATNRTRKKLNKHIPNLRNDRIWNNFSNTLANPIIETDWISYIRKQGWPGAAIVLNGSMQNVLQFHLREWVRKSPEEPEFEIGKGTHTFLNIKAGRELRPFMKHEEGTWSKVGFIWDLGNKKSNPSMEAYRDFSDIFGQDFHIHGFKNDGSVGGHTLFALLGSGKLNISLYPMNFTKNETGFLFNNDLELVKNSIIQTSRGLSVLVKNNGENFIRNLSIRLSKRSIFNTHYDTETKIIKFLRPGEYITVPFNGRAARSTRSSRSIELDRNGHFFEGGQRKDNNLINF